MNNELTYNVLVLQSEKQTNKKMLKFKVHLIEVRTRLVYWAFGAFLWFLQWAMIWLYKKYSNVIIFMYLSMECKLK